MSRAHDLLRALRHRWGSSLLVLILATVAVAAATVGPTYKSAAKSSIVQDTMAGAPGSEQGISATESGRVNSILPQLQAPLLSATGAGLGGSVAARRLLGAPIDGIVVTAGVAPPITELPVVWRDGMCVHLRMLSGHCPTAMSQIMISPSLAARSHWKVGTQVAAHPFGHLVVSGIYAIPDTTAAYWSLSSTSFFPTEENSETQHAIGAPDAAFTTRQTMAALPSTTQGTDTVDFVLHIPAVTPANIDQLSTTAQSLVNNEALTIEQASLQSGIPFIVTAIHASWNTLSTPILVITGELLILAWLLLFLLVLDTVEARASEVALARLRGFGRWRSVGVAVAEPVALMAIALPIGALIGWGVAVALGGGLRPGTPVPLAAIGWAAAAVATLGGVAAILVAAVRVLRRPVVEQWRRTSRGATKRGWVVDAVLLTAAGAGLFQLASAGAFATAGSQSGAHNSVALLTPALIGIAVAVVASRLLPLACRAAFGTTRTQGGLAGFLAVRQVARRPGGTRTVIILVTAFTLATFAIGSWSIARVNRQHVAVVSTGAATVFAVGPTTSQKLIDAVDRADPSGRQASAVFAFFGGSTTLLAVQPERFARVAAWSAAGAPQHRGLRDLAPSAPPPVVLNGQAMRLRLHVDTLSTPSRVGADFLVPGGDAPIRIDLGRLTSSSGTVTRTAGLIRCPCSLADLALSQAAGPLQGAVRIESLEVRNNGVWRPVPGVGAAERWRVGGLGDTVTAGPNGLSWSFSTPANTDTMLSVNSYPDPLPVIASTSLANNGGVSPVGLDANPLPVTVAQAVPAVPGDPVTGVVVDLTYAERAALDGDAAANPQVWVAAGAAGDVAKSLRSQGIQIESTMRASTVQSLLQRQGPGLASSLFLLDAGAAALLAALGTVVGLGVSARRRRYEYAALAAGGVSQRELGARSRSSRSWCW